MVRNEKNREQATLLRERGFTLQEIAKVCDVSKSTVSKWLKNNTVSADITKQNKRRAGQENAKRLQLVNKARNKERATRYQASLASAAVEFKHYKVAPLFMAGLMLYASSGEMKDDQKIRFSTIDIVAHKIVLRFCKEYLGVSRADVRVWLHLYSSQQESVCMKKWQNSLQIPYQQFHRTQFVQNVVKSPLHSGVGNTIIGSTVLQRKLKHWVKLAQRELVK